MKKITILVLALCAFLTMPSVHSQNDNGAIDAPGDIAILSYHADNGSGDEEDGITFLLIDDAPAGTMIRFLDEEWNGTAFASPTGEGELLWENNTGSTISAGTVVTIFDADGSSETASLGTVDEIEAGFNLGTAEDFVAITGTRAAPGTFLTAVDGNDGVPFITTGTGLSASQILSITGQGRYTGITECNSTAADCLAQVYDTASNWTFGDYPHVGIVVSDFLGSLFFVCGAPTAQATSAVFGPETSSTLTISGFTAPAGGAGGYVIYINDSNSFVAPADGDEPIANTNWNDSGQQAIYFGASNSPNVTVTGLNPGTSYFFQIYAYNDCTGTETYETTGLNASDSTSAATLTIIGLTGDDKIYDGTTAASASGVATLSGVAAGDDVILGGAPVFTFSSANVGVGLTITSSGFTISGADAGNYTLTQPTLSGDISAAELTIIGLTGDNKVYDGTTVASATGTATLSGVVVGDDVSLGGAPTFTFASSNVGTGITINTAGYTLSGTDSGNYTLTQPTLSGDITGITLTITGLTGDNKVYDGTTVASATGTANLSGVIVGDDVTLGGAPTFAFASSNVGTGITINTAGYTISGTDSGNYTLTQPTLLGDISAAELTITGLTGDNKVYDGTTVASATGTATLSGVATGDDVTLGGAPTFTFDSSNVGVGITINTAGYTISGTDSGNYTLTQPTLSGDITGVALIITGIAGDNKAYDGTTIATASGTATLSGVVLGDDVTLGGSPIFTFASANVGVGITINTTGYSIGGTDSGNYTLTQPTLSGDITGIALTITGLAGDNKVYDGTTVATASGTATLSGVVAGDDVSLGGAPTFTFASLNVGTGITINTAGYTISGTDSGNYTLTQPTLSGDISAAELTITGLAGDNKIYDGTTVASATGTATLSGVVAGDDVSLGGAPTFTFASSNVGTGITINTAGYTISGTDSGNYTLTQPTLSGDISAAELTIVGLTGDNKVFDGTTTATTSGTASLSGVIGADDVSLGGTPIFTFASPNVGTGITINTSGYTISGTDSGNYTLTQPTLSGDITGSTLTITGLNGDNKVYDGTTNATASGTATLSGVASGDDVVLGGSPIFTFASANVGTGITINTSGYTLSGADAGNYTLIQPTLSGDITAVALTVSGLAGDDKIYDGTTSASASGTASLLGVVVGDDVTLGGSPIFSFASANAGTGIAITSTGFTISGTDSGNYTLTQPILSADITTAELTVTGLTGDDKVFDGTTNATASGTPSLSGVIGADDVVLGGTPVYTFASPNVGTGITITTTGFTISGTDSGNYSLTQPTLSADITGDTLVIDDISVIDESCPGAADGSATVTASGGAAPYSYEWSTGDTTTVNTLSGLAAGNYTVTVVDALNNSVSQAFTIAAGTSFDVTLTEDPTVYLGYFPASYASIGVESISGGGIAPFTYLWSTGETTDRIHVCPTETTTYTVTVTDAGGCSTTAEVTVNVVDIRCDPHGYFHKVSICFKGRTFCVPVWKVRWYLLRGATLGGCESTGDEVEITNLRVFPNPFRRNLFVKFTSNVQADVDIVIFNHRGNQVFEKEVSINPGRTKVRLNLRRLKRGVYYLKIAVNGDVKKIRRIIKY